MSALIEESSPVDQITLSTEGDETTLFHPAGGMLTYKQSGGAGGYLEILTLGVEPEERGHGIGFLLINRARQEAAHVGCRALVVHELTTPDVDPKDVAQFMHFAGFQKNASGWRMELTRNGFPKSR